MLVCLLFVESARRMLIVRRSPGPFSTFNMLHDILIARRSSISKYSIIGIAAKILKDGGYHLGIIQSDISTLSLVIVRQVTRKTQ